MMKKFFWVILSCMLCACTSNTTESVSEQETSIEVSEMAIMVEELKELSENGNPRELYHWNKKRAAYYQSKIQEGTPQQQINTWFEFCKESLKAGENQVCIDEVEGYLELSNKPYKEMLDKSTQSMFELLALAYLRLGEQENCQNKHTSSACILPLQKEGIHELKNGSQRAAKLYALLLEKFPDEKRYQCKRPYWINGSDTPSLIGHKL